MVDVPNSYSAAGPYFGSDGMPLAPLYEQRNYFQRTAPFRYNFSNRNYIDLWYDSPFYGKTNQKGIFYVPNEKNIVFDLSDNASGFQFAIDALNDFRFYLKNATAEGKRDFESLLGDGLKVKVGYIDSITEYINYMKAMITGYNRRLLHSNVVLPDAMAWAEEFIASGERTKTVMSFYSFFINQSTNIASTGLAMSFANLNHNKDIIKWRFYSDQSFVDYAQAAANFGLRINLNAPWQVIVDLNSKPMRGFFTKKDGNTVEKIDGYLVQNGIPTGNDALVPNLDYLFENYHTKAIKWSYFLMQTLILQGWEDYRKHKQHIIIHQPPKVKIQSWKSITSATYSRGPTTTIKLQSQNPEEILASTWFSILEKIIKYEFNVTCDHKYRKFRKAFDVLKREDSDGNLSVEKAEMALTRLEEYYNITRIIDPTTGKPFWQTEKHLTNKNIYDKIAYEKTQPVVTEASKELYAMQKKTVLGYYGN